MCIDKIGKNIKALREAHGETQNELADALYLSKNTISKYERGEKVGIVGKNGAGKSTLLNIIQGFEPYDSGSIETGETIKFGYFAQKGLKYKEDQRVIDFIKDISENFPLANGRTISASQFLRLFLFDDQTQYSPISKLSAVGTL